MGDTVGASSSASLGSRSEGNALRGKEELWWRSSAALTEMTEEQMILIKLTRLMLMELQTGRSLLPNSNKKSCQILKFVWTFRDLNSDRKYLYVMLRFTPRARLRKHCAAGLV